MTGRYLWSLWLAESRSVMRERREHLITACPSPKGHSARTFSEVALWSKEFLGSKILVAETPLPERDIVLSVRLSDPNGVTAALLEKVFAFAFDKDFLVEGGGVRMSSILLLDGLLNRVSRDNKLLKYYGVKIIIYVDDLHEDLCVKLYAFLSDWCRRIEIDIQRPVTFDIPRDRIQFNYILENEHRRMVHGDIKAQYASTVMSI
jgi:hypothetical protein